MKDTLKHLLKLQKTLAEQLAKSSLIQIAVENANESFLITNADLDNGPNIIYVNRAFERMTGYKSDEVLGKTPRILQGPKTDRATLDRLKQSLKDGKPFFGRAINYRKNGTEYMFEWHIAALIDEDNNKVTHYVSVQRALNDLPLISKEELDSLINVKNKNG